MWPSGRVPRIRPSGSLRLMGRNQTPAASSKANDAAVGSSLCAGEPLL